MCLSMAITYANLCDTAPPVLVRDVHDNDRPEECVNDLRRGFRNSGRASLHHNQVAGISVTC